MNPIITNGFVLANKLCYSQCTLCVCYFLKASPVLSPFQHLINFARVTSKQHASETNANPMLMHTLKARVIWDGNLLVHPSQAEHEGTQSIPHYLTSHGGNVRQCV